MGVCVCMCVCVLLIMRTTNGSKHRSRPPPHPPIKGGCKKLKAVTKITTQQSKSFQCYTYPTVCKPRETIISHLNLIVTMFQTELKEMRVGVGSSE